MNTFLIASLFLQPFQTSSDHQRALILCKQIEWVLTPTVISYLRLLVCVFIHGQLLGYASFSKCLLPNLRNS